MFFIIIAVENVARFIKLITDRIIEIIVNTVKYDVGYRTVSYICETSV